MQKDIILNFKCPIVLNEAIEKDIEINGDIQNKSEWMLAAIRYYLDYRIETTKKRKNTLSAKNK